ncbi:InlB B-repeat-containing protein [Ruminococcus bromii]
MTKNGSSYYVSNLSVNKGGNFYFIVNKDAEKPYRNTVWNAGNDVKVDCTACNNLSRKGPQSYYVSDQGTTVCYYYISVKTDGSYSFTFDGDKTVTVTEGSIKPPEPTESVKITVPKVDNANVTAVANSKTYNEGDSFNIKVGSSFTVNVTGENDYTLNKITYGTQSKTETGANFTAVSDATTFSVDMVQTVSNPVTVTFNSNNSDYGTVSAKHNGTNFTSGGTVKVGDEVTFTATPSKGYTFTGWTVNDASVSPTTNPYTITVNNNTTVTANFKAEDSGTQSGYYILWGNDATFSEYKAKKLDLTNDGKYYASFNVATDNIDIMRKDCFFVFSTSNTTSGVTPEGTKVTVNKVAQNKFYFENNNSNISGVGSISVPKIWNENADLLGFKIIVSDIDSSNKKVTYSCEPTFDVAPADTVEITAKDGTIRAGYTDTKVGKTTAVLGDTTLSIKTPDAKEITASDSYPIDGENRAVTAKRVPNGSKVTVTTTIKPTATFAGHNGSDYYVKGFSVNGIFGGVLSQTEGKNHSSDVYTYTFEVNQEIYGSKLEITPVYFLKNDENCVYFYIENYDSAKQIWGNTPSCYVYYGSGKTTLEAFGYYPGQPMVDYNGSIFTQIPKSIVNGDTPEKITGMTLNNYVWDDVHSAYNGKDQKTDNAQTYDYDDFVKIADSSVNADNIIYRFKYNTHDNVPKDTLDTSDTDADGWEVFLDYQNYPTDIFGNRIGNEKLDYKDTQSVTSKEKCLSIISDGYQNNYIGKYATAWSIYNKAGKRVATIPSSALLYALDKTDAQIKKAIDSALTPADFLPGKEDRDTYWATFKTLYNDYKGFYAQINFEAAIKGGADYGNRLDGRWYYTKSSQKITGEIKIQYANTLDDYKVGDFHEDTFADENATSIVGTTTGASAYFTNPEDQVRKLETLADNTQDYKFEVNATSTVAYTFVGWYRLIDGDYKAINPSNMSSLTGAVTQNSDVTLVARYIKTPGGSMTFYHSLYNGTNAGGGKATTEIQVVVKNSKGELLYNSEKIAGTASIDKNMIAKLAAQTGLTVTVTLYTTTKNLYNFNGYYSAENTTVTKPFTTGFTTTVTGDRTKGLVTKSEYTFSFNEYYNNHKDTLIGDNAGTVYYNFYSDITSIKVPYKVQFSYTDRMGDQKYYNKAGYVDPEDTSSYTFVENATNVEGVESHSVKVTLTNSFILSLAPYESNFTKNLTWDNPTDSKPFDSSVSKSIASAVVNSTQSDKKIHLNVFRDKNGKPTPLINDAGAFVPYEKGGSAELPYGSVFYTKNTDGTYKYDITAPKTYKDSGKELQFMYWAIYSDPECNNLVIKAYNSDGAFSYVAYDNCWIAPVYGESSTPVASVKEVYTSTQFMEVTRNQWTAENADSFNGFDADSMTTLDTAEDFIKGNGEDKLYADFVLNFFYNGKQLSVFDPDSKKVQTGIVMQKLELEKDSIGVGYNTDMKYYANKYINDLPTAAEEAKSKILTGNSSIESLTKQIDNNRLDNKNRLQYYARFNNTETNANCVYRVYTYIKYVNESNETVVELGNPIYFTLYDIANATV